MLVELNVQRALGLPEHPALLAAARHMRPFLLPGQRRLSWWDMRHLVRRIERAGASFQVCRCLVLELRSSPDVTDPRLQRWLRDRVLRSGRGEWTVGAVSIHEGCRGVVAVVVLAVLTEVQGP